MSTRAKVVGCEAIGFSSVFFAVQAGMSGYPLACIVLVAVAIGCAALESRIKRKG